MRQTSGCEGVSNRVRTWPAIVATCVASLPSSANAQAKTRFEPIVNELFLGESYATQHKLELQTTAGFAWIHQRRADTFSPEVELALGLTDAVEIGVEVPVVIARSDQGSTAAGLGNAEVRVLHSIVYDHRRDIALSIGMEVELPASSPELGDPQITMDPLFIAYSKLGPIHLNATVSAEVGLVDLNEEGGRAGVGVRGVLSAYTQLGPVIPTFEIAGAFDEGPEIAIAPGVVWSPKPERELGVAFVYARSDEAQSFGVLVMGSLEFDLGNDDDDVDNTDEIGNDARGRRSAL